MDILGIVGYIMMLHSICGPQSIVNTSGIDQHFGRNVLSLSRISEGVVFINVLSALYKKFSEWCSTLCIKRSKVSWSGCIGVIFVRVHRILRSHILARGESE